MKSKNRKEIRSKDTVKDIIYKVMFYIELNNRKQEIKI